MTSLAGGSPATLTPSQIVDGWREGLKDVAVAHHQSGNYLVEIDGHDATVYCYATATHWRPDAEKRVTTFVGSYDFHLRRETQGWRITLFRYNRKYIE